MIDAQNIAHFKLVSKLKNFYVEFMKYGSILII